MSFSAPTPCVSIIIPVYNATQFLPAALDSAFAQSFRDFEIIIIDDGSTDDLAGALKPYEGRVQVLHQENAGPSTARNRGLRAARGEFIAFLDADDLWDYQKLELQVARMQEHPESGACFTECLYFDEDRIWEANLAQQVPTCDKLFETLLTEHFIPLSSLIVRRSCLDAVGLFDEGLIGAEDYNLYLRLARHYPFEFLSQPLLKSRFHPNNLSHDLAQMCHDEIANIDKISAMFPDLDLPKKRMIGQIWFRFGQYHFDAGDFAQARRCFAQAVLCLPKSKSAYFHWVAAALPGSLREGARKVVRVLRGTRQTASVDEPEAPLDQATMSLQVSEKPTRVMMVTWSFVAGGSENYALTLARHLDQKQFKPFLCGLDQGGALEPEIRRSEIPFYIMHRRPGIQLGVMWRMFRLFRRKRIDVVHTHHFNQLFYSFLGAKLCGVRIIHTEHSVESYESQRLRLALRLLAKGCHRVTVVGEDVERVMKDEVGIPTDKLQFVRTGIDLEAYNYSREAARRELGLDPDVPVALIVARLSSEKNHFNLLAAWAEVVRTRPDAILLIAGGGDEERAIQAEIERLGLQSQVQMLGVRRDVPRLMAACDAFVLCSDREGLPIVVLEAMAAARPVVATSVGDLPLVVREGETGALVPPRDSASLAKALSKMLHNRKEGDRLGENGRRNVQKFGLKPMIDAYQELYGVVSPVETRGGNGS